MQTMIDELGGQMVYIKEKDGLGGVATLLGSDGRMLRVNTPDGIAWLNLDVVRSIRLHPQHAEDSEKSV